MNDHPVTANVAVVSIAAAEHEIVDPRATGVLQVALTATGIGVIVPRYAT